MAELDLQTPPADLAGTDDPTVAAGAADASLSGEPLPEDSLVVALQKLYPQSSSDVLGPVANWLDQNFGVIEYADLESVQSMADMAMGIIAEDTSVSGDAKTILRELLGKGAGAAEPSLPSMPMKPVFEVNVPEPQCAVEANTTSGAQPEPQDSVLAALQKLFAEDPAEVLEPAAAWLDTNFGVVEYADLEGVKSMADAAMDLVGGDSSLSSETKAVLGCVFGKGSRAAGASSTSQTAKTSSSAAGGGYPSLAKASSTTMSTSYGEKSRLDDFEKLKSLGSGSFATVHRVKEKATGREFALKQINLSSISDDATREQIQQEIKIHKRLKHEYVLRCFETFSKYEIEFLLLQLAEGGDLYQYMQKEKLPEIEAARLFTEVASGIHYLHLLRWMHRDLKPENVLLALLEDERQAKIADFGEAAESSTQHTKECGSPAYMSPEMCAGERYDQRIDIWALGILLFEMLTNSWPFVLALTLLDTKKKIMSMEFAFGAWSNLPAPAQELLRSLICKDPVERLPLLKVMAHSWLESHIGTGMHDKATKLEQQHKDDERAKAKILQQMEEQENSTDESDMKALLKKAIAYELDNALVQKFRKRYDVVQWQTTRRHQLVKCAYHNSKTDVKNVLATVKEEGLDVPSRWILRDGPKLHARAELCLLDLEMGQKGSNYTAMNFTMDIEAQAQEDASIDEDEMSLLRVYREWQVSGMRSMLDVPAMQFVVSEELSQTLLERIEKLKKQVSAHRALQNSIVSQKIQDVQHTLEKIREDGLDVPEAWLLNAGPRLLARAKYQLDELERNQEADKKVFAELEEQARAVLSSFSILALETVIARLEAFGSECEYLPALRERCRRLRTELPLRLQLQDALTGEDLDKARSTLKQVREADMEAAEWLFENGPTLFSDVVARIERLDALPDKLRLAADAFSVEGLRAALEEADEYSAPLEMTKDAMKLLLALQDSSFVQTKIDELSAKGSSHLSDADQDQLSNLLKCLPPVQKFEAEAGAAVDRERLHQVMECMQMREGGFPVQLKCAVFLRTYDILIPAKQLAGIYQSSGSSSGASATSETDLTAAAQGLLCQLPKVVSSVDLVTDSDAMVRKTTVFLSAAFHRTLEDALQSCMTSPAVKIQAAWRGRRARAAVGTPLQEAVAVNKLLRQQVVMIDGALKKHVEGSDCLKEALQAMDDLLLRAMQLQIELPDVERYLKARERLACQASLARQAELSKNSHNTVEIDVAVARVAASGLEGPLVDELLRHRDEVRAQVRIRGLLHRCVPSQSIVDIEQTTAEVHAAGLNDQAAWRLPDGFRIWRAAAGRLEELQASRQERAELEQSVPQQVRDALLSLDVREMRAAILQSELVGFTGELVDQLQERHRSLELQNSVFAQLQGCIALDNAEEVASIVKSATDANLDEDENWLLAKGPLLLTRAQRWLSKLRQEERAKDRGRADIEQQISVLSFSLDADAMQAVIRYAEQANVRPERWQELGNRQSAILKQVPLCKALLRCDVAGIAQAQEAGLSSERSTGWILPDGPRLLARAVSWQGWMKEIRVFDNLENMSIGNQELVSTIRCLLGCLDSKSIADVMDAINKAQDLGLEELEAWTGVEHNVAAAGVCLLSAAQSRLKQLEEEEEVVLHSSADLDWQMRMLRGLLCPNMHELLGEPLIKALRERSSALQRQLPFRKALLFSPCEGDKALRKAIGDVKAAGLAVPEAWLLPEGPALYAAARRHVMGSSVR